MAKKPENGQYLTTEELADRWKVKVGTLEIWRQRKKGPKFVRLSPAAVRYPIADVIAYESANTTITTR